MNTEEVVHVNNIFIGFAYVWISCQILRFVWNSEMVTRMKSYEVGAHSRFSFHVRFMAVAYCFSVTFLFCGLTHVSSDIHSLTYSLTHTHLLKYLLNKSNLMFHSFELIVLYFVF
jgi:hypothetical protein